MTWVMYESPSTGNDRLVLLMIADEADDQGGNAYPSIDLIALKARVNRATVMRAIARLEGGGELLVKRPTTRGRGAHNRYCVAMGRDPIALAGSLGWPPPALDPTAREEWLQSATLTPGEHSGDNAEPAPGKGAEGSHETPKTVAPGATRRVDPLTQGSAAVGDPQPRRRRGLDPPRDVVEADRLVAAQRRLAEEGQAYLAELRRQEAAEIPDDPEERRRKVVEMRARRAEGAQ